MLLNTRCINTSTPAHAIECVVAHPQRGMTLLEADLRLKVFMLAMIIESWTPDSFSQQERVGNFPSPGSANFPNFKTTYF